MKIKLIYLAAGNSRRFSNYKGQKNKLLYEIDQKPMYRHLLDRLVKICQRHADWELILVTQYPEIERQIRLLWEKEVLEADFPVKTVLSRESYKGASYSIKAGLHAAEGEEAEAYAFFVADQPYFTEQSAEGFLQKMEQEAKEVPGCVTWKGQEGNPVWFPAKYAEELLALEGDAGGRKVFRRYREKAVFYEVGSAEELTDLDYMPKPGETKGGRIYCMENGKLQKKDSFLAAFGLTGQPAPRIAAVGAGGKTSLLKQLLAEYKEQGRRPVLVTTTHMKKETVPYFTTEDSIEKILEVREREGMVIAGRDAKRGRIQSLSEPVMEQIWKLPAPVLVEADGARMLPAKVPGEQEPVIPEQTQMVLAVYGLDAIGQRIKDCCFRPELVSEVLGKNVEELMTEDDLVTLAILDDGGKKNVLPEMDFYIVLNKADDERCLKMAERIALKLERDFEEKVRVTSFSLAGNSERKSC